MKLLFSKALPRLAWCNAAVGASRAGSGSIRYTAAICSEWHSSLLSHGGWGEVERQPSGYVPAEGAISISAGVSSGVERASSWQFHEQESSGCQSIFRRMERICGPP